MLIARLLLVVLVAIVLFDPQVALAQEQKQPTAVGSGGAAATVDLAGTQAAIQTLRQGGNAVDAAVAAAGVLGVTEPFSCGIGGGGFMVIRTAKGKITTIDGREESPRADAPRLVLGERRSRSPSTRAATAACRPASPARRPPGSTP